jgi:hypothetical protein
MNFENEIENLINTQLELINISNNMEYTNLNDNNTYYNNIDDNNTDDNSNDNNIERLRLSYLETLIDIQRYTTELNEYLINDPNHNINNIDTLGYELLDNIDNINNSNNIDNINNSNNIDNINNINNSNNSNNIDNINNNIDNINNNIDNINNSNNIDNINNSNNINNSINDDNYDENYEIRNQQYISNMINLNNVMRPLYNLSFGNTNNYNNLYSNSYETIIRQSYVLDVKDKNYFKKKYYPTKNNCVICYKDKKYMTVINKCLHEFCTKCIELWIKNHNNCPMCRTEIL